LSKAGPARRVTIIDLRWRTLFLRLLNLAKKTLDFRRRFSRRFDPLHPIAPDSGKTHGNSVPSKISPFDCAAKKRLHGMARIMPWS
jgi:hypothetical protein